jgi:muramoyltetrapeptide carboxypeptidase
MSNPRKLSHQAHIRVIAPASPAKDWKSFQSAVDQLRGFGFTVSFGKNFRKKQEYLAGSDTERLKDLHDAYKDKTVDAILTLRGGYGTTRLLDKIEYSLIKKNPKPIIGFSDITALHLAILTMTGVGSYSGPNLFSMFSGKSQYSFHHFLRAVLATSKKIDLLTHSKKALQKAKVIRPGTIKGKLVGGNLNLMCSLLGTKYFPKLKGTILFLEDVNEAPYKFDRLLTQLLNAGVLKGVRGILIGQCHGCDNWQPIAIERLKPLGIPMAIDLPFGHIDEFITLPIGCVASVVIGKEIKITV